MKPSHFAELLTGYDDGYFFLQFGDVRYYFHPDMEDEVVEDIHWAADQARLSPRAEDN